MTVISERLRRLSKEGLWILLGQVAAILGSLFGVRWLTEVMTPSDYGLLALGMTVATLVNQFLLGPLAGGIMRFYAPASEKNDLGSYFQVIQRLLFESAGVVLVMIVVGAIGLRLFDRAEWISISVAALVFALFSGISAVASSIQNAARHRSIVAFHQGVEAWLRFLAAIALIHWLGSTSTVAMWGYVLATVIILTSQFLFMKRTILSENLATSGESAWRSQILHYSLPFAYWGIFGWAQLASDRWALGFFATKADLGMYAVVFQLGFYPMSLAAGMAIQLLSPIFFQRAGISNDKERNANVSKMAWLLTAAVFGITGLAFLVGLLTHQLVFRIFVAKEYWEVSYLLPWMLLAGGTHAAAQAIGLKLMSQMRTHAMTFAKIATSIIGVVLNFIGAKYAGSQGVVAAWVIYTLIHFVWLAVLAERK